MTNKEMNWFLRGGKRPDSVPEVPVDRHEEHPLQDNDETSPADDHEKTYLVKVSQVKKCLWEGYVKVVADSRLEALAKARDEFENCELDTWDLVDPELDSENDEEPVFSVEPEA